MKEADKLRAENLRLREKLDSHLHAKELALKQAEDLREQKERLRVKLAQQKKSLDAQIRIARQLESKLSELREQNRALTMERKRDELTPEGGEPR